MEAIPILLIGIYFIPLLIALNRSHSNTLAIFVLNLLLGWSIIGWIIAAVWACTDNVKNKLK